jgi:hypothetical protein
MLHLFDEVTNSTQLLNLMQRSYFDQDAPLIVKCLPHKDNKTT